MKQIDKYFILVLLFLLTLAVPAGAATVSIQGPSSVTASSFDVVVQAQNVFAGRTNDDVVISYGFNVAVSDPSVFAFTGATSGPLFDTATTEPGTDVFGAGIGQNGFGVEPGAAEPLILAILHFQVLGTGASNIVISSDLSNLFQGLQYLNQPFQESIAGTLPVSAVGVPEPATILFAGFALVGLAALRRLRAR